MYVEIIGYWAASPAMLISTPACQSFDENHLGCDMTHISQKQQPLTHLVAMEADIQPSHGFSLFHLFIDTHHLRTLAVSVSSQQALCRAMMTYSS